MVFSFEPQRGSYSYWVIRYLIQLNFEEIQHKHNLFTHLYQTLEKYP